MEHRNNERSMCSNKQMGERQPVQGNVCGWICPTNLIFYPITTIRVSPLSGRISVALSWNLHVSQVPKQPAVRWLISEAFSQDIYCWCIGNITQNHSKPWRRQHLWPRSQLQADPWRWSYSTVDLPRQRNSEYQRLFHYIHECYEPSERKELSLRAVSTMAIATRGSLACITW